MRESSKKRAVEPSSRSKRSPGYVFPEECTAGIHEQAGPRHFGMVTQRPVMRSFTPSASRQGTGASEHGRTKASSTGGSGHPSRMPRVQQQQLAAASRRPMTPPTNLCRAESFPSKVKRVEQLAKPQCAAPRLAEARVRGWFRLRAIQAWDLLRGPENRPHSTRSPTKKPCQENSEAHGPARAKPYIGFLGRLPCKMASTSGRATISSSDIRRGNETRRAARRNSTYTRPRAPAAVGELIAHGSQWSTRGRGNTKLTGCPAKFFHDEIFSNNRYPLSPRNVAPFRSHYFFLFFFFFFLLFLFFIFSFFFFIFFSRSLFFFHVPCSVSTFFFFSSRKNPTFAAPIRSHIKSLTGTEEFVFD